MIDENNNPVLICIGRVSPSFAQIISYVVDINRQYLIQGNISPMKTFGNVNRAFYYSQGILLSKKFIQIKPNLILDLKAKNTFEIGIPPKSKLIHADHKLLAYINKTEENLLLTLIDRYPSSQKSANSVIQ